MFKKILFATDASPVCEIAAKTAFELKKKYDSALILMYVDQTSPLESCPFVPNQPASEKILSASERRVLIKTGMKKHYAPLAAIFGDAEYRVAGGKPSEEILKSAQKNKVDCIILGAHAQTENMAGKTLRNIIKEARIPVMSIARSCETSFWYFNQIIFGTDFQTHPCLRFNSPTNLLIISGASCIFFMRSRLNLREAIACRTRSRSRTR